MRVIPWNGKQIEKPGIYSGVPLDVYHGQKICAGPSVSSSGLRRVLEENGGSPAHFYLEWSGNPRRTEPEDKEHFVLGRALHHLTLGQPSFARHFVMRPDEIADPKTGEMKPWHGGRNACKDWLQTEPRGRTVLTGAQVEDIKGMSVMMGQHPLVQQGILNGKIECSVFWRDKETGLWLKVRPDAIPTDSGDAADLKSMRSVQWIDLMRSITDYAYHQQGALIRTAYREALEMELASFTLVCVEKKPPYCVRCVQIKPGDLDLGEKQNRKAIRLIAECIAKKSWPGPGANDDAAAYIDIMDSYRTRVSQE